MRVAMLSAVGLVLACATRSAPEPGALVPAKPSSSPTTPRPPHASREAGPLRAPTPDEMCRADGYDFAFGVESDGDRLLALCSDGPGTPCASEADNRCEGTKLLRCNAKRLAAVDCRGTCQNFGPMPSAGGFCKATPGSATCVCCDAGEPGCEHETAPARGGVIPLFPGDG